METLDSNVAFHINSESVEGTTSKNLNFRSLNDCLGSVTFSSVTLSQYLNRKTDLS